jgi:hypothetical protein
MRAPLRAWGLLKTNRPGNSRDGMPSPELRQSDRFSTAVTDLIGAEHPNPLDEGGQQ